MQKNECIIHNNTPINPHKNLDRLDRVCYNICMKDIVYFELNNWFAGQDYPANERFGRWMGDDLQLAFSNEDWVKENKLCVVRTRIDMSVNFCVTATKEWVENNCPELLTEYTQFLREPDEYGDVYSRFGMTFLEYCDDNIGIIENEDDW